MTDLAVVPLTGVIGAEVSGVDLAQPLAAETVAQIRTALLDHLVLVFRDQPVAAEQLVEFARCFGDVHFPPVPTKHGGPPEINVLDQVNPRGDGADNWHNDNTYVAEPPMGSILHAVQLPPTGGDTCFASMYAAHDVLSPAMQGFVAELRAVHDVTRSLMKAVERGNADLDVAAVRAANPPVEHPVVVTHPETGRRALFVNPNSTSRLVGVNERESDAVLGLLYDHVRSPDFQCRLRWQTDTVALFDNRCVQHYAVPDYHCRRIMRRVTIAGVRPA